MEISKTGILGTGGNSLAPVRDNSARAAGTSGIKNQSGTGFDQSITFQRPALSIAQAAAPAAAAGAGAAAAKDFIGKFDAALKNPKAWTITKADCDKFDIDPKYIGNVVRIVKAETDALFAEIDKAYAALPAGAEAKAFHDGVAARLQNVENTSPYEKDKTFAKMLKHLDEGLK